MFGEASPWVCVQQSSGSRAVTASGISFLPMEYGENEED